PFTGFDPLDDMQMHELQAGLLREGDIVDIARFVAKLRESMDRRLDGKAEKDPTAFLVRLMCGRTYDPSSVLSTRLRNAASGMPVLRALQQDVLETLNRVLETTRLDRTRAFADVRARDENKAAVAAADSYYRHGNLIFGNRKLVEAAFPDDVRRYDF